MNEVEHDIESYQGWCWRYPPKPKAEGDDTNRGLIMILDIMRKSTPVIVLLCIQKAKSSARGTGEHLMRK